jgi:hypothetical protein
MTAPTQLTRTARFPGAAGTFALLGEVLVTGVLVALCALPLVTLPAAMAAGVRHLDRYLHARDSRIALFLHDLRTSVRRGGLLLGFATVLAVGALLLQIAVVPTLGMPGADVFVIVAAALILAVLVLVAAASAAWAPTRGWRHAITAGSARLVADPVGALLIAVAVGLTALAGWQLPPLLVPAVGCLCFALVVVRSRRRR